MYFIFTFQFFFRLKKIPKRLWPSKKYCHTGILNKTSLDTVNVAVILLQFLESLMDYDFVFFLLDCESKVWAKRGGGEVK